MSYVSNKRWILLTAENLGSLGRNCLVSCQVFRQSSNDAQVFINQLEQVQGLSLDGGIIIPDRRRERVSTHGTRHGFPGSVRCSP